MCPPKQQPSASTNNEMTPGSSTQHLMTSDTGHCLNNYPFQHHQTPGRVEQFMGCSNIPSNIHNNFRSHAPGVMNCKNMTQDSSHPPHPPHPPHHTYSIAGHEGSLQPSKKLMEIQTTNEPMKPFVINECAVHSIKPGPNSMT